MVQKINEEKNVIVYTNYSTGEYKELNYEVGDIVSHKLDPDIKGVVHTIYRKLNKVVLDEGEAGFNTYSATAMEKVD